MRAGQQALDNLAPSEGAKLFADALELLGGSTSRELCEALIGLGEAQRQSGVAAHRETLLEASAVALQLKDAELAARAALANNRGWTSGFGEVDVERVAAIEGALGLDDPPLPARRARLLSLLAVELTFAPEHARRWALADEAVALARQAGDPRTLAAVLVACGYAYWAPDTLAKRAELVRELMAVVVQVKDLHVEYFATLRQMHIAMELCDFARADAAIERLHAIAEQTRQPTQIWNTGFTTAAVRWTHGELETAERLAEEALHIGQEGGEPDAAMIYGSALILTRMYQGRGSEVIALLEQTVANVPGLPAFEAALGLTYCLIDRCADGAEVLSRAAARHFEHLGYDQTQLCGLVMYADTAAQTGSVEAAAMLYELLGPYADQFVWNGGASFGHARMYLGLLAATLGRHEQADAHFAFACAFHHEHGLLVWEARSELGWADALAERGESQPAREHAARALDLARVHGYGAFEPGAAAILTSHTSIDT